MKVTGPTHARIVEMDIFTHVMIEEPMLREDGETPVRLTIFHREQSVVIEGDALNVHNWFVGIMDELRLIVDSVND